MITFITDNNSDNARQSLHLLMIMFDNDNDGDNNAVISDIKDSGKFKL